jgi:hypothetical protein
MCSCDKQENFYLTTTNLSRDKKSTFADFLKTRKCSNRFYIYGFQILWMVNKHMTSEIQLCEKLCQSRLKSCNETGGKGAGSLSVGEDIALCKCDYSCIKRVFHIFLNARLISKTFHHKYEQQMCTNSPRRQITCSTRLSFDLREI